MPVPTLKAVTSEAGYGSHQLMFKIPTADACLHFWLQKDKRGQEQGTQAPGRGFWQWPPHSGVPKTRTVALWHEEHALWLRLWPSLSAP